MFRARSAFFLLPVDVVRCDVIGSVCPCVGIFNVTGNVRRMRKGVLFHLFFFKAFIQAISLFLYSLTATCPSGEAMGHAETGCRLYDDRVRQRWRYHLIRRFIWRFSRRMLLKCGFFPLATFVDRVWFSIFSASSSWRTFNYYGSRYDSSDVTIEFEILRTFNVDSLVIIVLMVAILVVVWSSRTFSTSDFELEDKFTRHLCYCTLQVRCNACRHNGYFSL